LAKLCQDGFGPWLKWIEQGHEAAIQQLWDSFFPRPSAKVEQMLSGWRGCAADGQDVAPSALKSFCPRAREGRFPLLADREALPLAEQALRLRREILGGEHQETELSLHNWAAQYEALGEYAKAEPLFQQALEIQRKARGEGHPDYAASLNNLTSLYDAMGEYAKAEPLFQQALEIQRKAVGEGYSSHHPDAFACIRRMAYMIPVKYSVNSTSIFWGSSNNAVAGCSIS
jgi:tetratricopeptide (TPR) repeat protein